MKQKTPQEKKSLSYAKDRRNTYGANDKASRKSIPLRKALRNRTYRKNVKQLFDKVPSEINLEEIDLIESEVRSIKKEDWKKYPDAPLGKVVEAKIENRAAKTGKGKTARKKEREIVESMGIETRQEAEGIWFAKIIGFRGLIAKGRTEKEAVGSVRVLARAAVQNDSGFDRKVLIDGNWITPILEKD